MLARQSLQSGWQNIPIVDGELYYWPEFLSGREADRSFRFLRENIVWHIPRINLFGNAIQSPRMAAWYGDANAIYTYSGLTNHPLPWINELSELKYRLEQETQYQFNSVLANLYRDGNDSMGWHSDNEPELGVNPVIASMSLGGARRFVLRHKKRKAIKPVTIELAHGSLLLMSGETQNYWRHSIPKIRKPVASRINLTFRLVKNANS
ncbi:MAG: alpha-ketoglutarate-dependent dioxygenase AlkB [Gammaproteobacteria bacterium]|nr:alpha-ketoglutarate-dependent dioxygenase AlkB [Gammaproteobacteria bacterium]